MKIEVVYITRFNLRLTFERTPVPAGIHLDPAWLSSRVGLFEKYCVPKMAAQSDMDFRWLILVDPATPPDLVSDLSHAPNAEIIPVDGPARRDAVRRVLAGPRNLITSRIDSDDQISCRFTETLRKEVGKLPPELTAIYFVNGLTLDAATGNYHFRYTALNQFPAVYEQVWDCLPLTVLMESHSSLPVRARTILIPNGEPMWCSVVHGGNVVNTVRGKRTANPPRNW